MEVAMRIAGLILGLGLCLAASTGSAETKPVKIGFDGEFGHVTSTSAQAIRQGILIAVDEINAKGGVLGGRKLELVERDNRSVPARGVANIRELAADPDVVAVFSGKFSPVVIEQIGVVHELGIPLLDPWAAADEIVDNGQTPNFVFRLSLRDGWALPAILAEARKRGLDKVAMMLPNTAWGRSSLKAAETWTRSNSGVSIVESAWYNWGERSLIDRYQALRLAGAKAIVLVANEGEGSILVKEIAALPKAERLPVLSHWGVSGGDFVAMTGGALAEVDFSVVQTYTFVGKTDARAKAVIQSAERLFGIKGLNGLKSQVGLAHAYDLTHILALAIDKAGSTDRKAIRDALEKVERWDGLVKTYAPPFAPDRHEALIPDLVFLGRFGPDGIR
ncbi:ABC transporter substrate-binding protein [Magnetospirillum sp. SS-4]|uniref:ABC transporter substrate-binding protein n=1 Tax=Magnetospirillum sp. SS-4 TaxID=2681465 RepID=UPI00137D26DE|nr:ABC transporter substrate-binding protein [Magnetospirillum sp. SS-4]CAA7621968.1 putative ABC transporter, periplasmic component [Magnetospirillum sp. SS-4]